MDSAISKRIPRQRQGLRRYLQRWLDRLRRWRGARGPTAEYLYRANHIQAIWSIDLETFARDPARYLFALPPELQALWNRQPALLPRQRLAARQYPAPRRWLRRAARP